MRKNVSQFIKASCVFLLMNGFVASKNYAQDRVENGGSLNEAAIVSERIRLEETANKIIHFFESTPDLREVFPEVNVEELIGLKNHVNFSVVEEELRDREGSVRVCLNSHQRGDYSIRCQLSKLRQWAAPQDIFVLVMHELLGLLDVEVSSVLNLDLRSSYPISSRLYLYVTQTANYDLRFISLHTSDVAAYRFSTIFLHPYNTARNAAFFIEPPSGSSVRIHNAIFSEGDSAFETKLLTGSGKNINNQMMKYVGFSRKTGAHRLSTRNRAIEAATREGIARCEIETGKSCYVIKTESDCHTGRTHETRFGAARLGRSCRNTDETGIEEWYHGASRCMRKKRRDYRQDRRAKICGAYVIIDVRN